jgi:signal transduction histidine kinase
MSSHTISDARFGFRLNAGAERLPTPPDALGSGGPRLALGFGSVLLVATLHVVHNLSHRYSVSVSLLSAAALVLQCAALTLGRLVAQRWKLSRGTLWSGAAILSAVFGLLLLVPLSDRSHFSGSLVALGGVLAGLCVTGLWLALFELPLLVGRARLQALELESLRREAELSRLRVHLHPHFLLNTLNAIAGLVTEEPAEAMRLIAALGDLFRDALSDADELQPFRVEVAWLQRYAEILESRHRGALSFQWELAEQTLSVLTPRLLLQPLVENAIKHGALRKRSGGSVLLRSELLPEGWVRFSIEDDGPGTGPHPTERLGLGLVRRRLALLCPGASLRFERKEFGTRAVVQIPKPSEVRP